VAAVLPLAVSLLTAGAALAQASLVRDIETRQAPVTVSQIVLVGGKTFFQAIQQIESHSMLWVSDGTPAGTRVLLEGCPSYCLGAHILGALHGVVLWHADSGLWRSDGTLPGTYRLDDPAAGFTFTGPDLFVNGVYVAYACSPQSCALWRTDGTVDGTRPLQDFKRRAEPGPGRLLKAAAVSSSLGFFVGPSSVVVTDGTEAGTRVVATFSKASVRGLAQSGNRIFFAADSDGDELWTSDGTAAGTRALTHFSQPKPFGTDEADLALQASAGFAYVSVVNGKLKGLWRSDGTPAGTRRIADKPWRSPKNPYHEGPDFAVAVADGRTVFRVPGAVWTSDGDPATAAPLDCGGPCPPLAAGRSLAGFRRRAVFSTDRREIWGTDGTPAGTVRLAVCPAPFCPRHQELLSWPQGIAFVGWDAAHGAELWITDGTSAGTRRLTNLPGTSFGFLPSESAPVAASDGRRVVIRAPSDGVQALWTADAAGTRLLTALPASASSYPHDFHPLAGGLVFTACSHDRLNLWRSSGTENGTLKLTEQAMPCEDGDFRLTSAAGFVFFQVDGDLWRTDGTPGNTLRLTSDHNVADEPMAALNGELFFFKDTPAGRALWQSDGTVQGTAEAFHVPVGGWPESASQLGSAAGFLWYIRYTVGNDFHSELWRSDGTLEGTVRVDSPPTLFPGVTGLGNQVFFLADDRDGNTRVWRADGSAGGSYPLVDADASHYTEPAVIGGALYFVAGPIDGPLDLYRSDGTPQGTVSLLNMTLSSEIGLPFAFLTGAAGRIFFSAQDGVHGMELWSTDGTAAGTRMVRDIAPGPDSSSPAYLAAAGGLLYFTADDGVHGFELWQSDGTAAGTRLVQDIAPGGASSIPANLTASDSRLWMNADDGATGRELWTLPLASLVDNR
jgi:ELWxxDGT repeat protein